MYKFSNAYMRVSIKPGVPRVACKSASMVEKMDLDPSNLAAYANLLNECFPSQCNGRSRLNYYPAYSSRRHLLRWWAEGPLMPGAEICSKVWLVTIVTHCTHSKLGAYRCLIRMTKQKYSSIRRHYPLASALRSVVRLLTQLSILFLFPFLYDEGFYI